MDNKDKAINILSSGVNIYSNILYYTGIVIISIILLYNIYAFFRNLKDYMNNDKYIQNLKATIEKLNKEKIGVKKIKNTKYSSTYKDEYLYNLTLSFMINNEKITINKEETSTNIYNVGDIMDITYNTNLKKIDKKYGSSIIINIILILLCSGLLFLYYKYPDEIKGFLLINNILK